jgi:hypothetical protein
MPVLPNRVNKYTYLIFASLVIGIYLLFNRYCLSMIHGDDYTLYQHDTIIQIRPDIIGLIVFVVLIYLIPFTSKYFKYDDVLPKTLRNGTIILTVMVSWNYIFYDFNFFMNEWHLADRLLIVGLTLLTIRYPLFLFPLIAEIYLVDYQFNFPLGGSKLLDKSMPLEFLKLWVSFLTVYFLSKKYLEKRSIQMVPVFLLLAITLYGFFYFHSGIQKIMVSGGLLDWPFKNEIIYNLLAIRDRGWLLSAPQWIRKIHFNYFDLFGTIGQVLILITELAGLIVLWNKRLFRYFIFAVMFLHIHVFILNGALFWMWITVGIILLLSLKYIPANFFSWKLLLISVPVIFLAQYEIKIAKLGWFDSRLDNYFELEADLADGSHEKLNLYSIEPYTLHFQYGNFLSVVNYKNIYPGFIIINRNTFDLIQDCDSAKAQQLIEEHGVNVFRPEMYQNIQNLADSFLIRLPYAENTNRVLRHLQPPAYWSAHVTDTKPDVPASNIKTLYIYHVCVLRHPDQSYQVLWKRLITGRMRVPGSDQPVEVVTRFKD